MVKLPESFGYGFESDDEDGSEKKLRTTPATGAIRFTLEQSKRRSFEEDEDQKKKEKAKKSAEKSEKKSSKDKVEEQNEDGRTKKEESATPEKVESDEIEAQKHEIIKEQLEAETADLKNTVETSEPGSPEQLEAAALLAFTERLNQKLEDPAIETDPEIDLEFDRRMNEISESELLEAVEVEPDEDTPKTDPLPTSTPSSPVNPPIATSQKITTPPPASVPVHAPVAPSRQASTPPPPPPPVGPTFNAGGGGASFNTAPAPSSPNVLTPRPTPEVITTKDPSDLLIGGVLGYMVGRRGGRKRTERKLQPEINRLNAEVDKTKRHLASREDELKKAITLQTREHAPVKREVVTPPQKRTPISEILRQTVTAPERIMVPPKVNNEQVAAPVAKPERKPVPPEVVKKVENLTTPEILRAAESMQIEGVSVRRLYETNQIDRNGLIHIVQEGLRGKDIKKAFEKVEVGRERQRERAREFRHDDPSFTAIASDDAQNVRPQATAPIAPLAVPNNPDPASLQPISNQPAPLNIPIEPSAQPEDIKKSDPKQSYLAAGTVFAIGVGLLVVWLLFSL